MLKCLKTKRYPLDKFIHPYIHEPCPPTLVFNFQATQHKENGKQTTRGQLTFSTLVAG